MMSQKLTCFCQKNPTYQPVEIGTSNSTLKPPNVNTTMSNSIPKSLINQSQVMDNLHAIITAQENGNDILSDNYGVVNNNNVNQKV